MKRFLNYVDKYAKVWWEELPESERYPFHEQRWHEIKPEAKETIYGLWVDSLRGINYVSTQGELISPVRSCE